MSCSSTWFLLHFANVLTFDCWMCPRITHNTTYARQHPIANEDRDVFILYGFTPISGLSRRAWRDTTSLDSIVLQHTFGLDTRLKENNRDGFAGHFCHKISFFCSFATGCTCVSMVPRIDPILERGAYSIVLKNFEISKLWEDHYGVIWLLGSNFRCSW